MSATANLFAFTPAYDTGGNPRQWHLAAPNPSVPTNSVNRATHAIRFYLPTDTANAGSEIAERNNLRVAFAQWQAISGAQIKFEEAGTISGGDINLNDGTNLVFFTKTELVNGGRDSIFNRGVALTYYKTLANNEVAEADIVFNSFQFSFFSDYFDKQNGNYFIESTALHEIGHWLGLDHSPAGAATMFVRTQRGVGPQSGLSTDEIAAARFLYPVAALRGALKGIATLDGSPLFGGVITLDDASGNVAQSTVTQTDGSYLVPALAPGDYKVRLTPLDPAGSSLSKMQTGADISPTYAAVLTTFLPTTNFTITIAGNATNSFNLTTTAIAPAFRITRLIPPSPPDTLSAQNSPAQIAPGTSGVIIGVAGPNLPTTGATLEITGPGITLGPPIFAVDPFGTTPPLHTIYATIAVASTAAPGMRTLIVRSGADVAYANGFLEITPPFPDDNFDGLDDNFQRRYFPLFTTPEAAPAADPDHDNFTNQSEYIAGTDPTNPTSLLTINQIDYTPSGARVQWQSVPGKRYQLWSRDTVDGAPWQTVNTPTTAASTTTETLDPQTLTERFYRVEVLP